VKSGHVLLVRRKECPGKGLFALPGGYLKTDQWIRDSAICELKEETSIGLLPAVLKERIKESRVFDHPERSLRGRTVTHAYLLDLGSGELPVVEGADDAQEAFWMPICDLMLHESQFFEDHLHILIHFLHRY
jgi:bifunctional NMN adenylyltransferase/nudix hydrolase